MGRYADSLQVCKNCIKSKRDCAGYSQPNTSGPRRHATSDLGPENALDVDPRWFSGEECFQQLSPNLGNMQQLQHHQGVSLLEAGHLMWNNQSVWTSPNTAPAFVDQYRQPIGPVSGLTQSTSDGQNSYMDKQQFAGPSNSLSMAHNETHLEWPNTESSIWRPVVARTSSGLSPGQYNTLGFAQHSTLAKQAPSIGFPMKSDGHLYQLEDPEDPWDIEAVDTYAQSDCYHHRQSSSKPHIQQRQDERSHPYLAISKSVSNVSSPLLEEKSQQIFRHFVTVTGPCMGTFERHDYPLSNGLPKIFWTHELPTLAFQHVALAHAVLAVGAMHMSRLGLCSESIALKHFTYACRRVGKSLGEPQARLEVSTLATVLLLGYYEVMGGDHSRWSLHLSGAANLVMEHNYAVIMKSVRRTKMLYKADIAQVCAQGKTTLEAGCLPCDSLPQLLNDDGWRVSEHLVSRLTGFVVDYNTQVQPNFEWETTLPRLDQTRVQNWITQMELYWWYCKQDIFQSMLSGEPLLLPYRDWKYCPPRGPINNVDKAHATMDHLWLLLARLTDFSGIDRKRKQRVVEAQGGQWVPAPGFLEHRPDQQSGARPSRPSANEGRARTVKQTTRQPPPQRPMFYGMIPPAANEIHMSPSFEAMNAQLSNCENQKNKTSPPSSDTDLDQQTKSALAEHSSICEAFDYFESCLGADFRPLSSDDIQITTPFGPAIRYKSSTIAAIWAFFLVGKIVLRRAHPYSPPAAMMSAGVNATFTKEDAQLVGRICGGLFAQHSYLLQAGHVDRLLSAAVMEVTFPLLFAAVQFQDAIQRGWTIGKLSEIAQETGWQSSAAVAAACETTWEIMGLSGKGPPYERTLDQRNTDPRVNGKYWYLYGLSTNTTGSVSQDRDVNSRFISHDRSLIDRQANTRVHWALGLLSVEEDLMRMALSEKD